MLLPPPHRLMEVHPIPEQRFGAPYKLKAVLQYVRGTLLVKPNFHFLRVVCRMSHTMMIIGRARIMKKRKEGAVYCRGVVVHLRSGQVYCQRDVAAAH